MLSASTFPTHSITYHDRTGYMLAALSVCRILSNVGVDAALILPISHASKGSPLGFDPGELWHHSCFQPNWIVKYLIKKDILFRSTTAIIC